MDVQSQLNDLKNRLDALEKSSSIPRSVEVAMRTRLGVPKLIIGQAQLVSGVYRVTNPNIKNTSVALALDFNSNTTGAGGSSTFSGQCFAGYAQFSIGGGSSSDPFNYVIFC